MSFTEFDLQQMQARVNKNRRVPLDAVQANELQEAGQVPFNPINVKKLIRLRQSSKPKMNKLENSFLAHLIHVESYDGKKIHIQSVKFKLANGLNYTPDFFSFVDKTGWEVKGKWVDGDSFPKLKMAASVYPEISWRLVWKVDGQWKEQVILP